LGVDGMKAITAMVIEGPQQHQFLEGKLPSEISFDFLSLIYVIRTSKLISSTNVFKILREFIQVQV